MRNNVFVASTLANDPHTEGMHQAGKIARLAGIDCVLLKPSIDLDAFCKAINHRFVGLPYNLDFKQYNIFNLLFKS